MFGLYSYIAGQLFSLLPLQIICLWLFEIDLAAKLWEAETGCFKVFQLRL